MKKSRTEYPVRTCLVCGVKKHKSELIRYVFDDGLVMDERQIRQKRGAYVCEDEKCKDTGLRKGKLLRSLQGIEYRRRNRKTG
jgi:predicted RNA-binding protein YlxR (DUF448 family)